MTYIPRICNVTKMTFIRYRIEVIGFEMVTFKDTRYLFLTKKNPDMKVLQTIPFLNVTHGIRAKDNFLRL